MSVSAFFSDITFAILTVSDSAAEGKACDESGPALARFVKERGGEVACRAVVPDEQDRITQCIAQWIGEKKIDVILTTGGTGIGPRDVTPEALLGLPGFRPIPGFGELLRAKGALHTPMSYLSRSLAGIVEHSLVIAFPGKPTAVSEGMEALEPLIPHALLMASGGGHGTRKKT